MTAIERNFICTYTEERCQRADCTRDSCKMTKRAPARKNVSSVTRPTWRGTIKVGRRYVLRNGATVTIEATKSYSWFDPETPSKGLQTIEGWIGRTTAGRRLQWQIDGHYAPECGVRPHELDIVGTAL